MKGAGENPAGGGAGVKDGMTGVFEEGTGAGIGMGGAPPKDGDEA